MFPDVTEVLRPARPGEEPRLKLLWKLCFEDEDWYIDGFFDKCYVPGQAMVLEADGEIRSMLLVFEQTVAGADEKMLPFWYVYAFCTHPEGQGRGYGRRLLAWTEEQAKKAGMRGVVMVPGERSLFEFYATLGYQTFCATFERHIVRENVPTLPVADCSPVDYQARRRELLRGRWRVEYPEVSANWQARLCADSGGGFFRVGDGIAAVERWGGSFVVKELLSDQPERAAQSLLAALDGARALVRTPVPTGEPGRPFGVMKWLDPAAQDWWQGGETGYLAFAFD